MRVLIAGCGNVGFHLAHALARENLDLIVLDPERHKLDRLENSVDCQLVQGSALSPQQLEDIGIRSVDLVVAVTNNDALNMAICQLAAFYQVPRKLARLRHEELADPDSHIPPAHFGIDQVISPEGLTVDLLLNLIRCPGAREAIDFERGRIAVRALVVEEESPVAGLRLMDLRAQLPGRYLVAAIRRGGQTTIPDGKSQLRIGDTAYVISAPEDLPTILPHFEPDARPASRVVIYGASFTGQLLARRLSEDGLDVALLDEDRQRAERAAVGLDPLGVSVHHGLVTDLDLLQRLHIETADFFIALSDSDEANLTGCLLYRRYGRGRPIVLINQPHYVDIVESIDLDIVVNPRLLAVSSILRHIRGSQVLSGFRLMGEHAEVLELRAEAGSPICAQPLRQTQLPKGTLLAAALRHGELVIPGGDFHTQAEDRVLLFTPSGGLRRLAPLFRKEQRY